MSKTIKFNNIELTKLYEENKNHINKINVRFDQKLRMDDTLNQLIIFYNYIHRIIQTIVSSKQGILDMSLLSDEELKNISSKQIKYLKVKSFIEKKIVLIVIQKPIFSDENCKFVRLYPVPNLENKEIIDVPEKIIKCNNKKIFDLNFKLLKDNCTQELFKTKIERCSYIKNYEHKIVADIPGIIITINIEEIILLQNCNQDKIKIKGNNLIKFNNCTINIFGKDYSNYETINNFKFINNEIKIISPIVIKPRLEEIKEFHIENLKEIHLIKRTNLVNYSINAILGVLLTAGVVFVVIKLRLKYKEKCLTHKVDEDIKLRHGGVTSDVHYDVQELL